MHDGNHGAKGLQGVKIHLAVTVSKSQAKYIKHLKKYAKQGVQLFKNWPTIPHFKETLYISKSAHKCTYTIVTV